MEINPACVFDVQKLGVEQISKSSGYVSTLQKPLKKIYFPYKKNFALNPPLPYHKIVAGPQGIAFSPGSPTISTLPPNGSPQLDKQFPKESIISTLSLQFEFYEKSKKFKGAFVTLDKEDRLKQAKEYGELFFTIDEKDHLMTSVQHSAIFICIAKPTNSKHLEAHIFICLNEGQALDILRALKGELVTGQGQCSETQATNASPPAQDTNQGAQSEPPANPLQNISYPPVSHQQYTGYPPPQQSVPMESNPAAGYEHMLYNMRLNAPANLPYPAMPPQSPYLPNQATSMYPPPIRPNYYPDMTFGYPNQTHPTNPNLQTIPHNPMNVDGSSLTIPRPIVNSSSATSQEMTSEINDSNFNNSKFPRPVVTSQSHQLPSEIMNRSQSPYPNQTLPQNTYQNQTIPQNPYPNQTLLQNTYQNQAMPQNPYSNQALPQNCYPNQALPQNCYPNQTMPRNCYPNQTMPRNCYPNLIHSQNIYPNLQPVSNPNFQQPNQPYLGGSNMPIPYSSAQPNNQQAPAQGNQQSFTTRPTGTPSSTEKPLNPRLSMASTEMNISGGQKMSLSEEPSGAVNQVSPPIRPNVPSKPSRPLNNPASSNPGLKQPRKVIGVRVMPVLPNTLQVTQSTASNDQAAISDVGNKASQELSQ